MISVQKHLQLLPAKTNENKPQNNHITFRSSNPDTFTKQQVQKTTFTGTIKPVKLFIDKKLNEKVDKLIQTQDTQIAKELKEDKEFASIQKYLVKTIIEKDWPENKKLEILKTLDAAPVISKLTPNQSLIGSNKTRTLYLETLTKMLEDPKVALNLIKAKAIPEDHQQMAIRSIRDKGEYTELLEMCNKCVSISRSQDTIKLLFRSIKPAIERLDLSEHACNNILYEVSRHMQVLLLFGDSKTCELSDSYNSLSSYLRKKARLDK
ncbi:MAG: hypothetical protein AB7V50_09840 [Vampirovibrionia bacterium]